jgi:hypothetical protein
MSPSQAKRLTRAIHRWLSFQRMCGREMFFSERYLSQPVAEFTAAHHTGKVVPELNHPQFTNISSGRPKQVDFALITPNANSVDTVIETKWVRDSPYPKQAIVDDLLRLECFRDPNRHVKRYFLIGGLRNSFSVNFLNLKYRDGTDRPFIREFLNTTLGSDKKTINIRGISGELENYFKRFEAAYRVEVPKKFKTKLVSRSRIDGVAVYIWQIESTQNRQTFSPAAVWRSQT